MKQSYGTIASIAYNSAICDRQPVSQAWEEAALSVIKEYMDRNKSAGQRLAEAHWRNVNSDSRWADCSPLTQAAWNKTAEWAKKNP